MTARRTPRLTFLLFITASALAGQVFAEELNVRLFAGRSIVIDTAQPIARVSLTSADVADAMVTEPTQLLVQGKVPGTISMFVWDRGGTMHRYNVTVERDLTALSQQYRELFRGETISAVSNGRTIVVSGTVSSKLVAEKAAEVAAGHVEKKEDVVNLLQVREGPPPQVLLRVRFAEVSRNALTELGASYFTGVPGHEDVVGRVGTQQFPAPEFDDGKLVFSDFLNLFLFNTKEQLGGVIRALQTRGLFQSLAEPNLVAESGKEASFLAGGEFPIPVAQAGAANLSISVMFKEFGVRLNFTPTVVGSDRIRLKVRPEVSSLDFTNAIVLQGFRIPALSTRRTETELELQNGQTFAIAGLLNNTMTESMHKIPGIGDIPILGLLFRSKAAQKNRTELVVMITPEIVTRNSPGVTDELPRLREPYLDPLPPNQSLPSPPPAFTPGSGTAGQEVRPAPAPASAPAPAQGPGSDSASSAAVEASGSAALTPETAAAILRARMPRAPQLIPPESTAGGGERTRTRKQQQ